MNASEDLNNSLKIYKSQLEQVELAIGKDDENIDLFQLKVDLQQLIHLTEESLSKQASLSPDKTKYEGKSSFDDEFFKFYSEISSDLSEASDSHNQSTSKLQYSVHKDVLSDDPACQLNASTKSDNDRDVNCDAIEENCDEISGTKCRLQYGHEWGEMTEHNAVILSCEDIEGELMARVLFCNPTHNSMRPCSYYLEDCCKFEDHECKFSHGHLVSIDQLMQYKDPDYSLLSIGSLCLAKDTDDLWYKASVVGILEDATIQISFNENGNLTTLEAHNILPLALNYDEKDGENDDLYSCSSSSNGDDAEIIDHYDDKKDILSSSSLYIKTSNFLGEWEQYTKAIGSKLMAKMGYITGQGLGRNSDGRAEPVPIQLLPQGKSLDKIMEFRERSKNGTLKLLKTTNKKLNANNNSSDNQPKSVFDFMNAKLNIKQGKERSVRINKKPNSLISITTHDLTKKTDKHINVQLLRTADEINKIRIEINKLNTGLERNLEKNEVIVAKKFQQKIYELEKYCERLKTSEKFMNQQKLARKARKELAVF